LKLKPRLKFIASLIPPSAALLDVGCDHGLLPAAIARQDRQSGAARRITASDIAAAPLAAAQKNAEKYGVSDRIHFVRADGIPENTVFDVCVVAGMGGETIAEILTGYSGLKQTRALFVLSPNTKEPALTRFLRENSFIVTRHTVRESGREYPVLTAARKKGEEMTEKHTIADVLDALFSIAPIEGKMDFDNVGLLVGRKSREVTRILTALDITRAVAEEAVRGDYDLIVSHHPLFFDLKSVTDGGVYEEIALTLAENKVAAICMHTNLDAADCGTSAELAKALCLREATLFGEEITGNQSRDGAYPDGTPFAYGRRGVLPVTIADMQGLLSFVKEKLGCAGLRYYDAETAPKNAAVVAGSGGSYLAVCRAQGIDTLITSDIKHNVWLEAEALGINLIDAGHFCTENLVIAPLAEFLRGRFVGVTVEVAEENAAQEAFF
jgi:dinuclear metal center YbgI/SA1388 family protein